MKNWSEEKRPYKAMCRKLCLQFPKVQPKKNTIMLPSSSAECVKRAVKYGLFDKNTHCLCVERNPQVFDRMKHSLKDVGINKELVCSNLSEVVISKPVDYAFIDLCGPIMADVAMWLRDQLAKSFDTNADFAITVYGFYRNCAFIKAFHDFIRSFDRGRDFVYAISFNKPECKDDIIFTNLALIYHIFRNCEFEIDVIRYKDTTSMYTFMLRNIVKGKKARITCPDYALIDGFIDKYCKESDNECSAKSLEDSSSKVTC